MDFNNNNFLNPNMNPYFTPTSFDSDNSDPTMYNMNQRNIPSWTYPNQYNLCPQSYDHNFQNNFNSSQSNGDSSPPSLIFNQLVLLIHLFKIHTQFHQFKIENNQS